MRKRLLGIIRNNLHPLPATHINMKNNVLTPPRQMQHYRQEKGCLIYLKRTKTMQILLIIIY